MRAFVIAAVVAVAQPNLPQLELGERAPDTATKQDGQNMVSRIMVSPGQMQALWGWTYDGVEYALGVDEEGYVQYISTASSKVSTSEGIRVGMPWAELSKIPGAQIGTWPGWGKVAVLPSGWMAMSSIGMPLPGYEAPSDKVDALFKGTDAGYGARPKTGTVPLVGHWRLNLGRTRYGNGADHRRRESFTCTSEGSRLRCVIQSVRQDGREVVGKFSAALDGPPAPVSGIPDLDAVQLTRPDPELLDATFLFHGKPVFAYRAYRSSDGASLTIVSVDPASRAALTTVVVYDRQ